MLATCSLFFLFFRFLLCVIPCSSLVQNEKSGTKKPNEEKGNGTDGEELNLTVKSSSSTSDHEHREVPIPNEPYSEITDIAEMDYSPARRKPPIHN